MPVFKRRYQIFNVPNLTYRVYYQLRSLSSTGVRASTAAGASTSFAAGALLAAAVGPRGSLSMSLALAAAGGGGPYGGTMTPGGAPGNNGGAGLAVGGGASFVGGGMASSSLALLDSLDLASPGSPSHSMSHSQSQSASQQQGGNSMGVVHNAQGAMAQEAKVGRGTRMRVVGACCRCRPHKGVLPMPEAGLAVARPG